MKKILTLTLSLLIAFTLCLTVSADGGEEGTKDNGGVNSKETLLNAISNAAEDSETTITLADSFSIDGSIEIPAKKNIVLDLNGKTLILNNTIGEGNQTIASNITSKGKLVVKDSTVNSKPTVSDDYSNVSYTSGLIKANRIYASEGGEFVLESGTLDLPNGVAANGDKTGNLEINSKITINGGYVHAQEFCVMVFGKGATAIINDGVLMSNDNAVAGGNGTNNENEKFGGTTMEINGGTLIGNITSDGYISMDIYQPQSGTLTITGGTFYSSNGNGICVRGGTVNISGENTKFIAKGTGSGKCGDSKVVTSSSAIVVDYSSNYYDHANIKVNISGGEFSSQADVIQVLGDASSTNELSISGGTFSSDVSSYLASNHNVAKVDNVFKVSADGATLPVEKATPAVEESAVKTLVSANTIKGTDSDDKETTVTVTDSTKLELKADTIELSSTNETKIKSVEDKILTDSTKEELKLIPFDISLLVTTNGTTSTITDLGKTSDGNDVEIKVTLYLDNDTYAKLKNKDVKVIRIHDDGTKVLETKFEGNALTFTTGKFSTYVIAYAENKPEEPKQETVSTKSYNPKDKNKDGVISCAEEMNSTNWIWSETKKACVYRVTNTSAK